MASETSSFAPLANAVAASQRFRWLLEFRNEEFNCGIQIFSYIKTSFHVLNNFGKGGDLLTGITVTTIHPFSMMLKI